MRALPSSSEVDWKMEHSFSCGIPGGARLVDDGGRGEGRVDPRLEVPAVAVVGAHAHHGERHGRLHQGISDPWWRR